MEDPSDQGAAEAAFHQAYGGDRETTAIVPVQGSHSYDKLWDWWRVLNDQVNMAVAVNYSNVVSQENTITIGLADLADSGVVREIMALNGILETAVTIVETQMILE